MSDGGESRWTWTGGLPRSLLALYFLGAWYESLPMLAFTTWLNDEVNHGAGMPQDMQNNFYAWIFIPWYGFSSSCACCPLDATTRRSRPARLHTVRIAHAPTATARALSQDAQTAVRRARRRRLERQRRFGRAARARVRRRVRWLGGLLLAHRDVRSAVERRGVRAALCERGLRAMMWLLARGSRLFITKKSHRRRRVANKRSATRAPS